MKTRENNDRVLEHSVKANDNEYGPKTRRRSEILENDILQAAWGELTEVGYARLTMEGVATRAKTNKPAVYRRWPKKSELVIATLQKFVFSRNIDVPNTGTLRGDLMLLLCGVIQPLKEIGADTIHGLLADHLGKELSFPIQDKGSISDEEWRSMMTTILKNAEKRGEISLNAISPRIISLPINLLQHEFLMSHRPIADKTVAEIIDDIFLPLVHKSTNR